jgi:hypothetical protein
MLCSNSEPGTLQHTCKIQIDPHFYTRIACPRTAIQAWLTTQTINQILTAWRLLSVNVWWRLHFNRASWRLQYSFFHQHIRSCCQSLLKALPTTLHRKIFHRECLAIFSQVKERVKYICFILKGLWMHCDYGSCGTVCSFKDKHIQNYNYKYEK